MFGPLSLLQNNERKIAAAVRQAVEEQDNAKARAALFAGGIPDVAQNGQFNSDGTWENFVGCGDDPTEGGCGP